ncbi:toll/interleukin-1 receptor domain-containing protein [Engelhardtia mirabilis]|uniref:WD domain, G-beta repeat n=1 Tax=Engelhardtia mirabilis TaxID=2528011 RepID=A0A518BRT3_9BACT|nr:WD domain, G-beta repeat [Planctomycetes bacterium Pla133]QDV04004.1 WD domain, G-beta repeat [Planctomycetes bacterium Pla86]
MEEDAEAGGAAEGLRVFVCYAHDDGSERAALATALGATGIEPVGDWLLTPGSPDFRSEIDDLVASSDAMVVLVSRSLESSSECRRELELAGEWGQRLVPVRIDPDCEGEGLPLSVRSAQWVLTWPAVGESARAIAAAARTDFVLSRFASQVLRAAREWAEASSRSAHLDGRDLRRFEAWTARAAVDPQLLPRPSKLATEFVAAARRRARRVLALSTVGAVTLALSAGAVLTIGYSREMLRRNAGSDRAAAFADTVGAEREALEAALDAVRPSWLPTPPTARIGLARAIVAAEKRFVLGRFDGPLLGMAFAPGGSTLALLTSRGQVLVVDVESLGAAVEVRDVEGTAIAFDAVGALVIGTNRGDLLWADPRTGAITGRSVGSDEGIQSLACAGPTRVVIGDIAGRVFVIGTPSGAAGEVELLTSYPPNQRLSLATSTDGEIIASSASWEMRFHSAASGDLLDRSDGSYLIQGFADQRRLLAVDGQGQFISAAVDPPEMGFFGIPRRAGDSRVSSAVQSRDGRWVVSGSDSGRVHLWTAHDVAPLGDIYLGTYPVDQIAATEDLAWIAVADMLGRVQVLEGRARGASRVLQGPRSGSTRPPLLPEAQRSRLTVSGDGVVDLRVDQLSGDLIARFEDGAIRSWPRGWSASESRPESVDAISTALSPSVAVPSGWKPEWGETSLVTSSLDRDWLAAVGGRISIRTRRTGDRDWRELARPGGISAVTALAFDARSSMLAIGDDDGPVAICGLRFDVILVDSSTGPSTVTALAFDPAGSELAAGYADGCVAVFPVSLRAQREVAEGLLARLEALGQRR